MKPRDFPRALPLLIALASLLPGGAPMAIAQSSGVPANSLPAGDGNANVRLPSLGDAAAGDLSVGEERRIGDQILREVRSDPDFVDDPVLVEYLQSLWKPLVDAARTRGNIGPDIDQAFAWEAFLVRDRTINAFAWPGGYVGVHLGLIAMTASRDELASVLAHELSHVTQRHIARGMSSSSRQSMVGMAAMLLGIFAAARSNNADMAQAAIVGSQAAMMQGQLNFSRDVEREADRVGSAVLATAGYSPAGMAAMFEKMDVASRLNDSGSFPYLRSHPLTSERISDARARAMSAGAEQAPKPTALHALMRARSRVLMDTSAQALRGIQAQEQGASPTDRLSALYASAMASDYLREPGRALTSLNTAQELLRGLPERDPGAERALTLLQAQVLIDQKAPDKAIALLDAHADGTRAVVLLRAQAALDMARTSNAQPAELKRSLDTLQTWVADKPNDALAWGLLSQTADQTGLRLRAIRAEAESRAAVGDLRGAIDRLRAGQRMARTGPSPDFIEASVIDSRLRDLDRLRRQYYAETHNGREPPPQ